MRKYPPFCIAASSACLGVSAAPEQSICGEVCWVLEASGGRCRWLQPWLGAGCYGWLLLLLVLPGAAWCHRESSRGPCVEATVEIGGMGQAEPLRGGRGEAGL